MKNFLMAILLAFDLGGRTATAQLHLITGSPNPEAPTGYVSVLFRVTATGVIEKVTDLATDPHGTEWIAASQDLRKALLVPKEPTQPLVVVDFDSAAVVKQCRVTLYPDDGAISHWLLDLPDRGPAYAELLGGGDEVKTRAMVLSPSTPCSESFAPFGPADAKHLVASGSTGVARAGAFDSMRAGLGQDGTPTHFFGPGVAAYFNYRVPATLYSDLSQPYAFVIANNKQLFAVSAIDLKRRNSFRLLLFRKSDQTWHRMPDVGETTECHRAFGNFVASCAAIPKGPEGGESAGRAEWRTETTSVGPSMRALFHESKSVFPGRLYLYDVSTDRTYTIATNQGDSEVLLVENGTVYYRASDRLYAAAVTEKGLGQAHLLVTSEVVRDAHWAFIKH